MFTIKNSPAKKVFKTLRFQADPRKRVKERRLPTHTPLWSDPPHPQTMNIKMRSLHIVHFSTIPSKEGIIALTQGKTGNKNEKYAHFSQSQVPMA